MHTEHEGMMKGQMVYRCGHHKFVPFLVILFGLTFLLQALTYLSAEFVSVVWPLLVIATGLTKMGGCRCC